MRALLPCSAGAFPFPSPLHACGFQLGGFINVILLIFWEQFKPWLIDGCLFDVWNLQAVWTKDASSQRDGKHLLWTFSDWLCSHVFQIREKRNVYMRPEILREKGNKGTNGGQKTKNHLHNAFHILYLLNTRDSHRRFIDALRSRPSPYILYSRSFTFHQQKRYHQIGEKSQYVLWLNIGRFLIRLWSFASRLDPLCNILGKKVQQRVETVQDVYSVCSRPIYEHVSSLVQSLKPKLLAVI